MISVVLIAVAISCVCRAQEHDEKDQDALQWAFDEGDVVVKRENDVSRVMPTLLCAECHTVLGRAEDLFFIESTAALLVENVTIWASRPDVALQWVRNPAGDEFELWTLLALLNWERASPRSAEASWWDGFEWTAIVCTSCGVHVGWLFERGRHESFFALTTEALLLFDDVLQSTDF